MVKKEDLDLSKLKQISLWDDFQQTQVPETLIQDHMGLIESIAAGLIRAGRSPSIIEFRDLVNWGIEGLIKAHRSFDDSKGTTFKSYAFYRVRGEMLDKIRVDWHNRAPSEYNEYKEKIKERVKDVSKSTIEDSTDSIGSTLDNVFDLSAMTYMVSTDITEVPSSGEGTKDPEIEHVDESMDYIWDEIKDMDSEDREILELFYVQGLKQFEIADKLKFSRSKMSRLHVQIIARLRNRLEMRYTEDDEVY